MDDDCDGEVEETCACPDGDVNGNGSTNVADVQCLLLTVLSAILDAPEA